MRGHGGGIGFEVEEIQDGGERREPGRERGPVSRTGEQGAELVFLKHHHFLREDPAGRWVGEVQEVEWGRKYIFNFIQSSTLSSAMSREEAILPLPLPLEGEKKPGKVTNP